MFFIKIQNLHELEKNEQWGKAICILKDKWLENRDDIDILLRLATECWYVMSNWEFLNLNDTDLNFKNVQNILVEAYNYFTHHCKSDNKALSVFGYMLSLFPNYFYIDEDKTGKLFLEYENYGKSMLEIAYKNEPENGIYKILYLGAQNYFTNATDDEKHKLNKKILDLFSQDTAIEKYFKEILIKCIS